MPKLTPAERRVEWKTAVVTAAVIATNVVGNYGLSRGLRDVGQLSSFSPMPYIHALGNAWVALGAFFMLAWLITRLALLSWADLSYVIPVTSFSYVLTSLAAEVWLHEHISLLHWTGIAVITAGVALVAATYPQTDEAAELVRSAEETA